MEKLRYSVETYLNFYKKNQTETEKLFKRIFGNQTVCADRPNRVFTFGLH